MNLTIPQDLLNQIHRHGEAAYPDEGAGFLLGSDSDSETRQVTSLLTLENIRQGEARRTRYLIDPRDYLAAENEAERSGLTLLGVFHSHPDHPNQPSEYDRDWAQPWFSYIITSIYAGKAVESRSWRLAEDRSCFSEEEILKSNQR
jgi:proteasome lid subunit RPN8/RPN11